MTPNLYSELLNNRLLVVNEKPKTYQFMTERHLQAVWLEQKYFKNLKTKEGNKIEILSPGIWNAEAGPDFLKAHIVVNGKEYKGDIEIHLNEEEWYHHGHHKDERYDNVVLHVSLWKNSSDKGIIKSNDQATITACLEEYLTISINRIVQLIDLDLYPYRRFSGSGKCASSCFKKLNENEINTFFVSAANWRLKQKKKYLEIRFGDINKQVMGGIAMALGYKHNSEAFADLFSYLLSLRDEPEDELLAVAFGCCGFFDKKCPQHWLDNSYYQNLKILWDAKKNLILHQAEIRLDHVRPYNHPIRRIVYLVKMLKDHESDFIWKNIFLCWEEYLRNEDDKRVLKNFKESIFNTIPNYLDSYWNHHYTFENSPKDEFLSLMGESLKSQIVINTVLPILFCEQKEEHQSAFDKCYSLMQTTESTKGKYLKYRFFGDSQKGKILENSQTEQGAFQLHKDFCIHYEASCDGCPFIEKMNSLGVI